MRIRRTLATAVAAAVTAPVVLLSAPPALAVPRSSGSTSGAEPGAPESSRDRTVAPEPAAPAARRQVADQQDSRHTSRKGDQGAKGGDLQNLSVPALRRAVAEAREALKKAVAAEEAAMAAFEKVDADGAPLVRAIDEAEKAAAAATTAREAADKALIEAEDALAELPDDATDDQKKAAEKAVADATAAVAPAEKAETEAQAKVTAAHTALGDALVAASREVRKAQDATAAAQAALDAAEQALQDALEQAVEGACVPEPRLTARALGVPGAVERGDTVVFTVRVANGTARTMDTVWPYIAVSAVDQSGQKGIGDKLDLTWSTAGDPDWQELDGDNFAGAVETLQPGEHADIKVRLKAGAQTPLGTGTVSVAADYLNDDDSCGGTPVYYEYGFALTPANAAATPGTSPTPAPSPAGGAQSQVWTPAGPSGPVATGSGLGGSLAATGSSSAVPGIALASGTALLLGAGAVYAGRRRRSAPQD
ncbi:hypothetical protein [Streptomyces lichenis]|uniref:LPXTG cell wall anchor domain-containing protein n=1 Tax=Streptomyces lichenis TaxID=2306967 RepID=A0ABT0I583_9ACTN|nr:hypothetical protein [Streptomyces lichenis]MCK8676437.1 hypothetical protein [Streptomyces lichenis]